MKIKFAIVGCGRIADRHAKQIINNGGDLIACCDNDELKLAEFSAKYNINGFDSIEQMLKSDDTIDVVSICTPNGLHAKHTITALKAEKHVVCEKPMALNTGDCKMMMDIASQKERHLFMVMQNRFNPPVIELKKIIDNNLAGKIFNVHLSCHWNRNIDYYTNSSWKGTKDLDGGILFTQFSHFIDILLWLFGGVKHINAKIDNCNHKGVVEIEDSGAVILQFENNILCTINYSVNAFQKNYEGALTVIGEYGIIKIGGAYLNKIEYCNLDNYSPVIKENKIKENDYGTYTGSMSNHHLVYHNVMEVFNKNEIIATTGLEGFKTVELIQNIYKAAL